MADEIMRVEVENSSDTDTNQDYISAINEMKANTVSKEAYDRLKADNRRLLDSLVNGKEIELEKTSKPTIPEMRKKLLSGDNLSNLEYVETALELRKTLIEKGERDPFLPYGDKVELNDSHYQDAENVAAVLQDCVDFADGDSAVFTAKLQAKLADSVIPMKRRK